MHLPAARSTRQVTRPSSGRGSGSSRSRCVGRARCPGMDRRASRRRRPAAASGRPDGRTPVRRVVSGHVRRVGPRAVALPVPVWRLGTRVRRRQVDDVRSTSRIDADRRSRRRQRRSLAGPQLPAGRLFVSQSSAEVRRRASRRPHSGANRAVKCRSAAGSWTIRRPRRSAARFATERTTSIT